MLEVLVELRLRKAGIKVVDDSSALKGSPYLHLTVSLIPAVERSGEILSYSFIVYVGLKQVVHLERNYELSVGSTWERLDYGYCGVDRLNIVKESVIGRVDEFSNDFLAVNPR